MKDSITPIKIIPETLPKENVRKQDAPLSVSIPHLEARIAELENELKKQKAIAEQGAKLMQIIWGDKFQSDSLH